MVNIPGKGALSVQGSSAINKGGVSGKGVEEEYIRNLQQQIYLLELETRYLKKGGSGKGGNHSSDTATGEDTTNSSKVCLPVDSSSLNDAFKSLKNKYVELQETNKDKLKKLEQKLDHANEELKLSQLAQENLIKEKEELLRENKQLSSQSVSAEDKVFNELATLNKRLEVSQAEVARLELSYNRVLQEKERLQSESLKSNLETARFQGQVEEQLAVHVNLSRKVEELQKNNASLQVLLEDQQNAILTLDVDKFKARIKELQQDKINLQTEVKQMESIRAQQDQLHKRMTQDYNDIVKANVTLQAELDELRKRYKQETERTEEKFKRRQDDIKVGESAKDELIALRDGAAIHKIALESRDRKITSLQNQLQDQDVALNKALENRALLEDRLLTCENRLTKMDAEHVELVKDKTLLTSQVSQLQHTVDQNARKLHDIRVQRDSCQVELERYQRQDRARTELSVLLKQIEQSGQNYMHLMQSVRTFVADESPVGGLSIKEPDELSRNPSQSFIPPPSRQGNYDLAASSRQLRHKEQLQKLVANVSSFNHNSATSLDDFALAAAED